jgi:hypothetical protein
MYFLSKVVGRFSCPHRTEGLRVLAKIRRPMKGDMTFRIGVSGAKTVLE